MSTTQQIVAITGMGGAQGSAIAAGFRAAGWTMRRVAREEPAPALEGAQVLVVTAPIDYRRSAREAWLAALLLAAERAGVTRLVLNLASRALPGLRRPVSESLRALEAIALAGPVPAVVLRPTVYMDNLLQDWAIGSARTHGVLAYPMAPDLKIAWISHRSLAEAAVAAATLPGIEGQAFDIAGPAPVTGPEVAALLAGALGKPVRFETLDPAMLAAGLNAAFGAPAGDDIADLYRHLPLVPEAFAAGPGNAALGLQAESFASWFGRQDIAAA